MVVILDKNVTVTYVLGRDWSNMEEVDNFRNMIINCICGIDVLTDEEIEGMDNEREKAKGKMMGELIDVYKKEAEERKKVYEEMRKDNNPTYLRRGYESYNAMGGKDEMNYMTMIKKDRTTGKWELEG